MVGLICSSLSPNVKIVGGNEVANQVNYSYTIMLRLVLNTISLSTVVGL